MSKIDEGHEVWLVINAFNPFGLSGTFLTENEAEAFATLPDENGLARRSFVVRATEFQSEGK